MFCGDRNSSGRRRLLLVLTAACAAAACASLGTARASADTCPSVAPFTTTTLAVTDANGQPITGTIQPNSPVTLTATVCSSQSPSGTIKFWSTASNAPIQDSTGASSWQVPPPNVPAGASYQVSATVSLPAGSYGVYAAFTSNAAFLPSSSAIDSVSVGTPLTLTTTTTLTASPNPIVAGQSSTLTATVTSADGSIPQGAVSFYGTNGNTKTFIQQATLNSSGQASITRSDWGGRKVGLEADYLGQTFDLANGVSGKWLPSSDSALTLVVEPPGPSLKSTTLTDLPDVSAYVDKNASLSAKLVDSSGNPIPNEMITLRTNDAAGTACTAQTDATGVASCIVQFPAAGTFTVGATFAGDSSYNPTSDSSQQIEVDRVSTSIAYTGATSGASGAQATLSAELVDTVANTPIAGQTLTFELNANRNEACSATTDATGTASCPITVSENGSVTAYPVTVTYTGSGVYLGTTGTGSFSVPGVPTTLTYVGDAHVVQGNAATLAAKLLAAGQPVSGETVTLTLASGEGCSATTDATGVASCLTTTAVEGPAGPDSVTLSFAGDSLYLGSTGSGTLTVLVPTTTALAPQAPVLQGGSAQLSAALTADGAPVSGQALTLSLGAQSCSATTSATGTARCSIAGVSALLGPATTGASFAATGYYLASSAAGSTYVYGLPSGGGAFVLGDRSDTGSVTFWGSQWWKVNSLSGGGDPSSFKGFALDAPSLACGAAWSTDPGNSAPPPAGPLPAYMAVLVSSDNTKSGSRISGNIVSVVIVETAPGYAADPGHAGTGTVVATLCKS